MSDQKTTISERAAKQFAHRGAGLWAFRVDPDWAYGFAEMDKGQSDAIANARFVANPGCWPQGLIGTVRPLIEAGLLPATYPVSYNGISGYTGGGKQMIAE